MEFRPCIDIHNGKVKQIVGSSLDDDGAGPAENFVSKKDADFFAKFYEEEGLTGGHIILLNAKDSEYYNQTKEQAMKALAAFPGGMQLGGGITPENAKEFIDAGASHVIVTSYVFKDGKINYDNLKKISDAVGPEHLVLDLSCKRDDDDYFVATDRWQHLTKEKVTLELLDELSQYCDEFLIHACDVEGKGAGVEEDLIKMLGQWEGEKPLTYAGGISDYDDIAHIREWSEGKLNITIGSALDLFGGAMNYETVLQYVQEV